MRKYQYQKQTILLISILLPLLLIGQGKYPAAVEASLKLAGPNRGELEKVLQHYREPQDSLKLKAACFLIANMPIHRSYSYYWADSSGKKIPFNELDYPDFDASLKAFEQVKKKNNKVHPVAFSYRDIDSIKASFLINNIELAFATRNNPWAREIPFKDFCEYVLPYRASIEPLQNWRQVYAQKYAWVKDSAGTKKLEDVVSLFASEYKHWFTNTWDVAVRKEPLPRLGALQLLHRKAGACEDIADLMVFALRSQGFMATNDMVSYWATSFGTHFFNSTLIDSMKMVRFDASTSTPRFATFAREPAKVIRTTYSRQPGCVAAFENIQNIPDNFLRGLNYKDVTSEFWPVRNITCHLFPDKENPRTAYLCAFNEMEWKPTWWGKVQTGSAVFTDMCQGAVFLPVYFSKGKTRVAGYPVASGYNNVLELKPDLQHRQTVHIKQQDRYLIFRPGKSYSLYYWDHTWELVAKKVAAATATELVFENVPRNALLILIPEYSQRKERPFSINETGERAWW